MISQKTTMASINIVGGTAVLGSYAYFLMAYPALAGDFWGGVPDGLRSVYTVNMFLAAAGYFAFTFFLMYRMEPTTSGGGRFGLGTFNALYAMILLPSALWMPLTFAHLEAPSPGLWLLIRLVLFAVGFASLGVLTAFLTADPPGAPKLRRWAIVGAVAFCFQTAVLDALVWPVYFPA